MVEWYDSGLGIFLVVIVFYKVVSYIIKLVVAATTAKPKKDKDTGKDATLTSTTAN